MIPMKLDYTKEECRGALRQLELEAYSNVVSTFRAQGSLDGNKQGILEQLQRCFHISQDRHKAEIRRVANCEKLTTISEMMNGKSFDLEWIREGHRNYPLISRAPSYSALHLLADHASKVAAMENSELNVPSSTRRDRVTSVIENTSESGLNIVTEDPTKPPISLTTPAIFGISKKDLKRNIDLVTMQHTQNKKKHYHLKPPPPPPNVKIQHLYQTLNSKRSRKSFTKKSSKAKTTKQSPNRQHLQFPYQTQHNLDDKFPDELQKHLTSQSSQLMPPPMSPMKINPYSQSQSMLPTNNKNLLKINHVQQQQNLEPQAHYIPNNRLNKNEIHPEQHLHAYQSSSTRPRSGRSKSISASSKSNVGNYLHTANNTGALSIMRNNSVDHIPDPQIIFNSSSSSSSFLSKSEPSHLHHHVEIAVPIESNDIDLSSQSAITSPLQLLSTAASCTPKLKINTSQQQSSSNSNNNANINSNSQPYSQLPLSLPTSTTTSPLSTASSLINQQKSIQNRAIKIVPATTKIVPKPPQSPQHQQQQQTILSTTSTPSKFKIQKFHLVMNKNQDGTNNTKSTSTATTTTPRVIVQTIDRNQIVQQKENSEKIPENNQRITEHTPIDFMPVQAQSISFPKVIFPAPKQIKLKLSPGSIVNSKIFKNFKGPLPANLKIQRNINTKGFTVLNTSQIVQFQSIPASSTPSSSSSSSQVVNSSNIMTKAIPSNESTKTDWEQELDEANRNKAAEFSVEKDKIGDINGSETVCKKARLEENIVDENEQSIIIEESAEDGAMINEEETSSTIIYEDNQQQQPEEETNNFIFLNENESTAKEEDNIIQSNIEEEKMDLGQLLVQNEEQRTARNGAEEYENLVKSLTECENDYLKGMPEDANENFNLIDTISYNRDSEELFQ